MIKPEFFCFLYTYNRLIMELELARLYFIAIASYSTCTMMFVWMGWGVDSNLLKDFSPGVHKLNMIIVDERSQ